MVNRCVHLSLGEGGSIHILNIQTGGFKLLGVQPSLDTVSASFFIPSPPLQLTQLLTELVQCLSFELAPPKSSAACLAPTIIIYI